MIGPNILHHSHIAPKPKFTGNVRTLIASHHMAQITKETGNIDAQILKQQ
jgi:hypothetical protein